jgi:hypothetical protein
MHLCTYNAHKDTNLILLLTKEPPCREHWAWPGNNRNEETVLEQDVENQ